MYSPSPKLNVNENLSVFSKGLWIFEAENKYDKSIFIAEYLKPAPKEKNFLAPFSSDSLKYPALKAKDSWYKYSAPKAQVNSLSSSLNPPGASPKDWKAPLKVGVDRV